MTKFFTYFHRIIVLLIFTSCVNIEKKPYQIKHFPIFDPQNAIIPQPNDILMDSETGLVAAPVSGFSETGKLFFEEYTNRQDGFSVDSVMTVDFNTNEIDETTINHDTVLVYDVTDFLAGKGEPKSFTLVKFELVPKKHPVSGKEIVELNIIPLKNLEHNHRYAILLTNGIKDKNGEALISPYFFNLLKAKSPLIDEHGKRTVLEGNLSDEEAAKLEVIRKINNAILSHFEELSENFDRKNIVLMWTFKTFSKSISIFNPATSDIPTPNDIVRGEKTLNFPISETDPGILKDLFSFFNTLSGFSVISTPTVKFSRPIDETSVDENSFVIVDITDPAKPLKIDTVYPDKASFAKGKLVLVNTVPFEKGHTYLCAVKNSIKTTDGENSFDVLPAPAMFLLLMDAKIMDGDKNLLAGIVDDESAAILNMIKTGYEKLLPILKTYGFERNNIVSMFTFTTMDETENLVDPNQKIIPLPNDLVMKDGKLNLPLPQNPTEIEKQFISWLNTFDGFSPVIAGDTAFSSSLSPESVIKNVKIFYLDDDGKLKEWKKAIIGYKEGDVKINIATNDYFLPEHKYFVVITDGLKDSKGNAVVSSSFMTLIKSKNSLFDENGNNLLPTILDDDSAKLVESIREAYEPVIDALEPFGIKRENIVSFFSFTIHSKNEALYSPTTGVIPFPNDVLLSFDENMNVTGVNIPVPADASDTVKEIYKKLSSLDGFSTLAPTYTRFSKELDKDSFVPFSGSGGAVSYLSEFKTMNIGMADITAVDPTNPASLVNLKVIGKDRIDIDFVGDTLVISSKPGYPFDENTRYMVAITSSIKSKDGSEVVPSPVFFLARSQYPLVDENGKSLLYTLSDEDASQLEVLRENYKPIFDAFENDLVGIPRDKVVLFWTFTTQSITKTLKEVYEEIKGMDLPNIEGGEYYETSTVDPKTIFEYSDDNPVSDDGTYTFTHIEGFIKNATFTTKMLLSEPDVSNSDSIKLGTFMPKGEDGTYPFRDEKVKFIMAIPKDVPKPMPIVIFQHGLGGSKVDLLRIADFLAENGFASIAIDAIYHGDRKLGNEPDGTYFITGDLFATRDNFRQTAIDLFVLEKLITDNKLNTYLESKGLSDLTIDKDNIFFLGTSLGGMIGTLFSAIDENINAAVLVAPPSHFSEFIDKTSAEWLLNLVNGILKSMGIEKGTPEYNQFLGVVQWIFDKADPLNYVRYINATPLEGKLSVPLLIEVPGMDELVPQEIYDEFAISAAGGADNQEKIDSIKKVFDNSCHAFLLHLCAENENEDVKNDRIMARQKLVDFFKFNLTKQQ